MNKRDLKKLSKSQLIKLLLKQQAQKHETIIPPPERFRDGYKPVPPLRIGKWENLKPKPVPRKSVKQMVKDYEDIILAPPKGFRNRPPKPTRAPPLPPNDGFNFDDDIFQTENTSLGKFKIISVQSRENKKFKSYKMNS